MARNNTFGRIALLAIFLAGVKVIGTIITADDAVSINIV